MEENKKNFFAKCTWPNSPVRAKFLSRFQLEGKKDVWTSQVRRVKKVKIYNYFLSCSTEQITNSKTTKPELVPYPVSKKHMLPLDAKIAFKL